MNIWKKILDWFAPKDESLYEYSFASEKKKRRFPIPLHCEYENCQQELNILSYRCGYCNKWHCEKHRLPEDHNCSGNPISPPKTKGTLKERGGSRLR